MTISHIVSSLPMTIAVLAVGASLFTASTTDATPREESFRVHITIGSNVFNATLTDSGTAKAFKAMLPLSVNMSELNANEKHVRLPGDLPRKDANPRTIHSGDLMLYGSNTLVLFYKSFPTSYSYTRIGKVDDATGIAAALGSRDVTVTFSRVIEADTRERDR
jgi:hypothetical protein